MRGPFDVVALKGRSEPTYPILWAHNVDAERQIEFPADSEGIAKPGKDAQAGLAITQKISAIWSTASNCHFNRDFRFNSQSTGMQFTPNRAIGGRAWLSLKLSSSSLEKALVLWGNSSLGLLMYWWHANKQQAGRGSIGKSSLEELPTLNVEALSREQIQQTEVVFEQFRNRDLRTLHEIDQDAVRAELDEAFLGRVLLLPAVFLEQGGPINLLRKKLAKEPSIRGMK